MRTTRADFGFLVLWALIVSAVVAGCAADRGLRPPAAAAGGSACVLVDTDAALDDFRAIALLARTSQLIGIVATEGISTPENGAMAIAHLVAAAGLEQSVPVLVGLASPEPPKESWLPDVRANAERLNGFLARAVPRIGRPDALADEVERLAGQCGEIRLVVLGPWTSFLRYHSRLAPKLRQVITQGLPLADVPAGRSPGFNCRYDLPACRQVNERFAATGLVVWVDVPRNATPPYAPTLEMIDQLSPRGLPGTLRALMSANRDSWKEALLWDDSAALYLLHPERFALKGAHQEPNVSPADLRSLWLDAANRMN
jgi:inosine-uridine nucleoside N-ribohydrolase